MALNRLDADDLDGVNLMPLVTGKEKTLERSLFWMLGGQTAVRNGKWKLLQSREFGPFLFDMNVPEPERINMIVQHPEVADGLRKELEKWKLDIGRRGWIRDAQLSLEKSLYCTHYGDVE
jgi:hypothetical protein